MPSPKRRNDDVANLVTFKDANKYATNEAGGRLYVVWSYGHHWPLFIYDRKSARWLRNVSKISPTTSRHATMCQPYRNVVGMLPVSCAGMLEYMDIVIEQETLADVPL